MRNYKRKTEWGKTPKDVMMRAALLVVENEHDKACSVRKVAKQFAINPSTLFRYVQKLKKMGEKEKRGTVSVGYAHQTVFNPEQESMLVKYLKTYTNLMYGLTATELRRFAYEYSVSDGLKVPRAWRNTQSAGVDWLKSFLKRHPDISTRKPEATSSARRSAVKKHNVEIFFENYEKILDRQDIPPSRIYNMDEADVHTVLKPANALTGVKQEESVTSSGGELVTVVLAASATGTVLPPMFILPRRNFKDDFIRDGPAESIVTGNKSGCQTRDTFLTFLSQFIKHTNSSKDNPALLFLDYQLSNISVAAIQLAKKSGVILVTFPPHCSHGMPSGTSLLEPFKLCCEDGIIAWMKTHPGETVTIYDLPAIIKDAFTASMTPANITAGLRKIGIWPFNKNIFTEHDFFAASVTDRPAPDKQGPEPRPSTQQDPSTSRKGDQNSDATSSVESNPVSSSTTTPESVRPILKAGRWPASKRAGKRRKSAVLTETPAKEALEAEERSQMRILDTDEIFIVEEPRRQTIPDFTAGYSDDNIFVAFETSLCYKVLSSSGDCSERVGVLLCMNMIGTILKPLVVGKIARPKVFGNLDFVSLPVLWRPSSHACITDFLLEEWLNLFNESMAAEEREVVLFLNTQSCNSDSPFSNVKIARAPQAMDSGVIQYFKGLYRKSLLQTILMKSCSEVEQDPNVKVEASVVGELCSSISVWDAVSWISAAVSNIPPNLVRKSLVASGFVPLDDVVVPVDDAETGLCAEIYDLCQRLNVDPEEVLRFEDDPPEVPLLIKEEPMEPMQEEDQIDIRTYSEALKAVNDLEKFAVHKNCPQLLSFLQGAKEALSQSCLGF